MNDRRVRHDRGGTLAAPISLTSAEATALDDATRLGDRAGIAKIIASAAARVARGDAIPTETDASDKMKSRIENAWKGSR